MVFAAKESCACRGGHENIVVYTLNTHMFELNIFSVFAATFLAVAIGIIWYSPMVCGRLWMQVTGVSELDLDVTNNWSRVLLGAVTQFCLFYVVGHLLELVGSDVLLPLMVSLSVFSLALISGVVLAERKSVAYFIISGGYTVVVLAAGGYVIALWPW